MAAQKEEHREELESFGRTWLDLGARIGPTSELGAVCPSGSGRVCCRSRLLLATLPRTVWAFRHLIGWNSPVYADIIGGRWSQGANTRLGPVTDRPLLAEAVQALPLAVAAARHHLSTLFSPPPPAGPGSAGCGREDAGPGAVSPSAVRRAAKRPEGGERHTKNAVGGGGERARQIRDGNSSSRPPVPPPPGLGPRPRRQCGRAPECGAPALPRPQLDRHPARPAPSRDRGAPSFRQPAKEVCPRPRSPATCKPGKVCGASAGRRDAARPTRPRSPRVTFSTRRQPGPQRGRRGLRGGPESVRGLPHLGLRMSRTSLGIFSSWSL
ncbi:LOW QUALITY PROTEIN: uncharacterized protein LOC112622603 [Theropithecus gelada]|uniref:LOW QUALITY PROTEIN: uncharacterized protein LOC112622603 n=1 Tax=Theropithecus gelada TaxID=9565 RepID=UPI000DC16A3D|nr:LOW QUALITY PROTEIN: uncharacterized protein LOC112622603 [Theropithecus gelada]